MLDKDAVERRANHAKPEEAQEHTLQQRRLGASCETPSHCDKAEEGNQAVAYKIERIRL